MNKERQRLWDILMKISKRPVHYYTHNDNYCCEVDCEKEHCDEHFGSFIAADYRISDTGNFHGAYVTVATGGPHIELQTQFNLLIATHGKEKVRVMINEDIGEAVHAYFEDKFNLLMSERPTRR